MTDSPQTWQRKRPADDDEEDDDEVGDIERGSEKAKDWKVKTLDEILQEKRQRLDDKEDSTLEGSKQSSRNSSPNSTKRLSMSSSPASRRSSSKHDSPAEVIYQLSPEQHTLSPREYIVIFCSQVIPGNIVKFHGEPHVDFPLPLRA